MMMMMKLTLKYDKLNLFKSSSITIIFFVIELE